MHCIPCHQLQKGPFNAGTSVRFWTVVSDFGHFSRFPVEVVGIDRLLFSVDYPYISNKRGQAFLDSLPEILGPDDIAKRTHGNAESLLNLRPAA